MGDGQDGAVTENKTRVTIPAKDLGVTLIISPEALALIEREKELERNNVARPGTEDVVFRFR